MERDCKNIESMRERSKKEEDGLRRGRMKRETTQGRGGKEKISNSTQPQNDIVFGLGFGFYFLVG